MYVCVMIWFKNCINYFLILSFRVQSRVIFIFMLYLPYVAFSSTPGFIYYDVARHFSQWKCRNFIGFSICWRLFAPSEHFPMNLVGAKSNSFGSCCELTGTKFCSCTNLICRELDDCFNRVGGRGSGEHTAMNNQHFNSFMDNTEVGCTTAGISAKVECFAYVILNA